MTMRVGAMLTALASTACGGNDASELAAAERALTEVRTGMSLAQVFVAVDAVAPKVPTPGWVTYYMSGHCEAVTFFAIDSSRADKYEVTIVARGDDALRSQLLSNQQVIETLNGLRRCNSVAVHFGSHLIPLKLDDRDHVMYIGN